MFPWSPRLLNLPRSRPGPRTQCRDCAGGGEINAVPCRRCDGRGWHDAQHPEDA